MLITYIYNAKIKMYQHAKFAYTKNPQISMAHSDCQASPEDGDGEGAVAEQALNGDGF